MRFSLFHRRQPSRILASSFAFALLGAMAFPMACGSELDPFVDGKSQAETHTSVKPRVVLDGLVDLSSRTEGGLYIEEVFLHAPTVQLRDGQTPIANVLDSDPNTQNPLFFHYSLYAGGSSGTAIGGDRAWDLRQAETLARPNLAFGFAPYESASPELEALLAEHGCDLSILEGQAAVVKGYVAVKSLASTSLLEDDHSASKSDTSSSSNASSNAGGERSSGDGDGDGDGAPAAGDGDGAPAAGDGDGAPAAGDGDGAPAAGDGDGAPAAGDGDGAPAAGDGDGAPAAGDGDGAPAPGDGDGAPAAGDEKFVGEGESKKDGKFDDEGTGSSGFVDAFGSSNQRLVPFLVVIPVGMTLEVPFDSFAAASAATSTSATSMFLPIDLHLNADRLFSDAVMHALENSAEEIAGDEAVVLQLQTADTTGVFGVQLEAVQIKVRHQMNAGIKGPVKN